jgi:hypothetical protein
VKELRRLVLDLKVPGAMLPSRGLPLQLGHDYYWPVYEEAANLGCALGMHGGSSLGLGADSFTDAGLHGHCAIQCRWRWNLLRWFITASLIAIATCALAFSKAAAPAFFLKTGSIARASTRPAPASSEASTTTSRRSNPGRRRRRRVDLALCRPAGGLPMFVVRVGLST